MTDAPELLFHPNFDQRAEDEAETRGTVFDVQVRIGNAVYLVTFVTPARMASELELVASQGTPWIGEAALIVVPRIKREALQRAVDAIAQSGDFFTRLIPEPA